MSLEGTFDDGLTMYVYVKHKGTVKTLQEIADECGIPLTTVYGRWEKGIRDYDQLCKPKYYRAD
jgi:hypothetical protein